jgi:hypothetical protein
MNGKKLLSLWGLKWNPFSPELPSEGLLFTPKIESFAWRVEHLVQEGGFALPNGSRPYAMWWSAPWNVPNRRMPTSTVS